MKMKIDLQKPRHLMIAVMAVSLVGFSFGYRFHPLTSGPASLDARFSNSLAHRAVAKAYPGGVYLSLASDQPLPIKAGTEFTLTAQISSDQDLSGLNLKWHVPPHAQLISGSDKETLSIRAGEQITRTVSFRAQSDRNTRIVAEIFKSHRMNTGENAKMGTVTQFNTNPDELDEIHRARVEDHQMHKMSGQKKIKIVQ